MNAPKTRNYKENFFLYLHMFAEFKRCKKNGKTMAHIIHCQVIDCKTILTVLVTVTLN